VIMFTEGFYATQVLPYSPKMTETLRGEKSALGVYSGILYTSYYGGMLASAYFWARLSNRIGRRPCMLLSSTSCMVVSAWMATISGYWTMVVLRFITGLANCNQALMRTALREIYQHRKADDTWAFSTLSVVFGASSVVGPSLGGMLYGEQIPGLDGWQHDWTLPWLASSLLYLVSLCITAAALPETAFLDGSTSSSSSPVDGGLGLLKDGSFLMLLTLAGGHSYVFTGWEQAYPLLAGIPKTQRGEDWSTDQVGVTFLIGSIALMTFSLFVYPAIAKKVPKIQIWLYSWTPPLILFTIFPRLLTYSISHGAGSDSTRIAVLNYGAQIVISMLLGSGFISVQLLLNEYVVKLPDSSAQLAVANSMLASTQALVRAISPTVNGSLFSIGRHGEAVAAFHGVVSRALPFDSLAVVGLVACMACGVSFQRRTC